MNGLSLQETHQWRGHWWVPGSGDRYAGVLRFEAGAPTSLELVGQLPNRTERRLESGGYAYGVDSGVYEVLHGDIGGREVTLLDCYVESSRGGVTFTPGGSTDGETDIVANTALLGVHLESAADRRFSGIEVRIEGLTAWAGQQALALGLDEDRRRPESIRGAFPEPQTARLSGDQYTLDHWLHGFSPRDHSDGTTVDIRHEVRLVVETSSASNVAELRTRVALVTDLVSLARHARSAVLGMRLTRADASAPDAPRWVDVLWRQSRFAGSTKPEHVAFTSAELGFERLLAHWSSRLPALQSAVHLLMASWEEGGYLEPNALLLATAVESFSSVLELGRKLDDEAHGQLIQAASRACPAEFHDPLRSMLNNFNEPSLRARIDAIGGVLPGAVAARLLPNVRAWSRQLYSARNQLSHSGETNLGLDELIDLRSVTSAVMYLVLLQEIGLGEDALVTTLNRDRRLTSACERSARRFGTTPTPC